jgi:chromatin modification-related protein VID21
MQADFKEERKWKMALALELAEAVVEWHNADAEGRVALRGHYVPPDPREMPEPIERGVPPPEPVDEHVASPKGADQKLSPANESDEEDEVQAAIEPQEDVTMAESPETKPAEPAPIQEPEFTMKTEDPESFNLDTTEIQADEVKPTPEDLDDSKNPVFFALTSTPTTKPVLDGLLEVRNPILDLDSDSLWIDPVELQNSVQASALDPTLSNKLDLELNTHGWGGLFSELPTYELSNPPDEEAKQVVPRDDEVQRKTIPISRFSDSQPLLLGALQPSLRLRNGEWHFFDEYPVKAEEGQRPTPIESCMGIEFPGSFWRLFALTPS